VVTTPCNIVCYEEKVKKGLTKDSTLGKLNKTGDLLEEVPVYVYILRLSKKTV